MSNLKINDFIDSMTEDLDSIEKTIEKKDIQEQYSVDEFVNLKMLTAETVGLTYDDLKQKAAIYYKDESDENTKYFDMDPDQYVELCEKYCDNVNDKFNHSNWRVDNYGNLIRVFTLLKPAVNYPNITISVSRKIPDEIFLQEYQLPEEIKRMIPDIIADNFVIIGASGSGKTYFLNRALKTTFVPNQYNRDKNVKILNHRIALIEEFHELFPPNKNTFIVDSCPVKPGETPIFPYLVQQSNLMRTKHIFVGEVKGIETYYFLNNLANGMYGGTTCHGNSVAAGLLRIRNLAAECCSIEQAGTLIAKTIKYAIYIDGAHVIREIVKLEQRYDITNEKWSMNKIYDNNGN